MDHVQAQLGRLIKLQLMQEELKGVEEARDRLHRLTSHPLEAVKKQEQILLESLSTFLEMDEQRLRQTQDGFSNASDEVLEYVEALEEVCNTQMVTRADSDYTVVVRRGRKARRLSGEARSLDVDERLKLEQDGAIVIGQAADLDHIDEILDWPG